MTLHVASEAFLEGYGLVRRHPSERPSARLASDLAAMNPERIPFAVEGAAMALEALDAQARERGDEARGLVDTFLATAPRPWIPFVELGVGCSLARRAAPMPDVPTVLDGYGFQSGLFGVSAVRPGPGVGARFLRGLGRAIWFRTGGDAGASAALVRRVGDVDELWRGLATACAFAGDPKGHATELRELGSAHVATLGEGAAEALRLWYSFESEPPDRVFRVAEAFLAVPDTSRSSHSDGTQR